jgi:hypothetical protein
MLLVVVSLMVRLIGIGYNKLVVLVEGAGGISIFFLLYLDYNFLAG